MLKSFTPSAEKMGQPTMAAYPLHWHNCQKVGHSGGYEDPSGTDSKTFFCFMQIIENYKK